MQPCPKCKSDNVLRIPRIFWMRLFKDSIHVECEDCGKRWWQLSSAMGNNFAHGAGYSLAILAVVSLAYLGWQIQNPKTQDESNAPRQSASVPAVSQALAPVASLAPASAATPGMAEEAKTVGPQVEPVGENVPAGLQAGLDAQRKGDYAAALKLLVPLANRGDATAQLRLGVMNETGQGMPENQRRAVVRYRQAAEQGNAEAQYRLGMKYDRGQGVAQDKKLSLQWYVKSAAQGYPEAVANAKAAQEARVAKQAKLDAEAKAKAEKATLVGAPAGSPETSVERSVKGWAAAWSARNVDDYFAAYAPNFSPDGVSHEAWRKQRAERIDKPKVIEVSLSNIRMSVQDDSHVTVSFTQDYRSDSYRDQVAKTWLMVKQLDRWLIAKESLGKAAPRREAQEIVDVVENAAMQSRVWREEERKLQQHEVTRTTTLRVWVSSSSPSSYQIESC